ncbi:MAG TPA: glycoside hydrolase family 3 N-terminal domain-containing protein [Halomicronema sp.]
MANCDIEQNIPDLDSLSLEEKVAQMFVIRASGYLFDHQIRFPDWEPQKATLQHLIADLGVGGVLLPVGNSGDMFLRSQEIQSWAKIPLLIASDVEEGVGQRFTGATHFPPPMALNAIAEKDINLAEKYAEELGSFIAQESLALGINWVLGPVVDVNNNPDNPVINVRSFGETPELVSKLATAFIKGAHQWPVLTVAKHFPGHGDTAVDSHIDLPILPHTNDRLNNIELPPFVAAIQAGVDAVMSAHLLIKSWDAEKPATLSYKILTEKLRKELKFEGLIVTDALVMGAIAKKYGANEAPILALEAGADILLMPADPAGGIAAICEAVRAGRVTESRITESVKRIWTAKQKIFSSSSINSSKPALPKVATPAAISSATNILKHSMKAGGTLPLKLQPGSRNLILLDDIFLSEVLGHHTPAIAFPRQLGYQLQLVDRNTHLTPDLDPNTNTPTLLQIFIRGNPFRGSNEVIESALSWYKKLLQTQQLRAIVIYGSPYTLEQFLPTLPPEIPFVFSYGQQISAQTLALETLFGSSFCLANFV